MQIEIRGTKYTPAAFTDRDMMRIVTLASSGIGGSLEVEKAAAAALRKVFPDTPGLTDGDIVNLHTFELLPLAQQLSAILAEDPNFKGALPALRTMLEGTDAVSAIDQLEAGFGKVTPLQHDRQNNRPRKRHQQR